MQIRKAESEDWSWVYEIHCDPSFNNNTGYTSPPSKDEVKEKWLARLSDSTILTLVAEVDGSIVGYIRLKRGTGKVSHTGEISILAVRHEWQRKRIGTKLVESLLDFADCSLRLQRLRLTLHADNLVAQNM